VFADSAERALECLEAIPERERSGDYLSFEGPNTRRARTTTEAERVLLLGVNRATSQPQVAREAAVL